MYLTLLINDVITHRDIHIYLCLLVICHKIRNSNGLSITLQVSLESTLQIIYSGFTYHNQFISCVVLMHLFKAYTTNIKNRSLKRILEHVFYLSIVFVLIPSFFYFELCIVLPNVVEEWTVAYYTHIFCANFLLLNIVSNMIYGMFTDTSIKGRFLSSINKENWTMCSVCECLRPPRAWHCNTCDICILKRDHHCTFFACCVGYFNHRYFIFFTLYIFISMMYAFYYNVQFLAQFLTWNHGMVIIKFIFPLACFVLDFGLESLYVFLVVINLIIGIFSGFLFFYHFNNLLKGRIVAETKNGTKDFLYNKGWKSNIMEVFGSRWYLTWISAFIHSPLPGNGVEWVLNDKCQ